MPEERTVMEADAIVRAWRRVAHEIAEAHAEGGAVMLVGIQRGGVALAQQLGETLNGIYGQAMAVGSVEPGLHRDDLSQRGMAELRPTELPDDMVDKVVVLVDDVLSRKSTYNFINRNNKFADFFRLQLFENTRRKFCSGLNSYSV